MNNSDPLFKEFDILSRNNIFEKRIPLHITENINPKFELRPYQVEALSRFFHYVDKYPQKQMPVHLMFQMATGSGKTLLMASLILHLYEKGYRNFLFFVNSNAIIKKTEDNFLNKNSSKYLFADRITIGGKTVEIKEVNTFDKNAKENINICFTSIQGLNIHKEKENSLSIEDFVDNKVVFLGDEAHHNNRSTKSQIELMKSWEETIKELLSSNNENYLLEFTATIENTGEVEKKYRDKLIYKYDLLHFRNDLFSKNIDIIQSDFDLKKRVLQAVLLSYYRELIASDYNIRLKPVILFKSRFVDESKKNHDEFIQDIKNLSSEDIQDIKDKTNIPILLTMFKYFDDKKLSLENICDGIKRNFTEEKCVNLNNNNDKELEKINILLTTLEDKTNEVRAIFAVNKLDEGWDVLNLFDIVRMYETRQSGGDKTGKGGIKLSTATISEAQLVGRGARYFPFTVEEGHDRYKRKYDDDLDHPLQVLEELYYHSHNEHRYISEIKEALRQEGLLDDEANTKKVTIKVKKEILDSEFYKKGKVYKNGRESLSFNGNQVNLVDEIDKYRNQKPIEVEVSSGEGKKEDAFKEGENSNSNKKSIPKTFKEFQKHIIQNALSKNNFTFDYIKRHFPNVNSTNEFIEKHLPHLKIVFKTIDETAIQPSDYLKAVNVVLTDIKNIIEDTSQKFYGTNFALHNIQDIFKDKTFKTSYPQIEGIKNKEWFVYDSFYGTSEEKNLVDLIERLCEKLKSKYNNIYLLRNERMLAIYNEDGKPFEPDFLLFGIDEKSGTKIQYQCFIEPKGQQLQLFDEWKNNFLKKIKEGKVSISENKEYRLTAVEFYSANKDDDREKEILQVMGIE